MHNVSTNRQLVTILRDFEQDASIKKIVCAAVTRCFLGGTSEADVATNSFAIRLRVHEMVDKGLDAYYEHICAETERQKRPVTLICIREFVIKQVQKDALLDAYLASKEKWVTYSNNTVAAAESLRTMLKGMRTIEEISHVSVLAWAGYEAPHQYFAAFCRSARRVPGLLTRDNANKVFFPEACKMIRKERDKRRADNSIVTERFDRPEVEGRLGLKMCAKLSASQTLTMTDMEKLSGSSEKFAFFKKLVRSIDEGKHALQATLSERSPHLGVAGDCLAVFHASCEVKSFNLPPAWARMQFEALSKRFGGDEAKMSRGSSLLCCLGCSTMKNFVVGSKPTKGNPKTSHGFKRVCHDGRRLMCDEKRLYSCCKTVPLKEYPLLTGAHEGAIVEYAGKAYALSTCCGHVTLFTETTPTPNSPLTCAACLEMTKKQAHPIASEKCEYCEKKLNKSNKGFGGMFVDENDVERRAVFCKTHTKKFMKKEFEPMNLAEVKEALMKGSHI